MTSGQWLAPYTNTVVTDPGKLDIDHMVPLGNAHDSWTGVGPWVGQQGLEVVDLVTWNKARMGMGYRTRRVEEYLRIMQKPPKRAEGVWQSDDIPDVVTEGVTLIPRLRRRNRIVIQRM